MNAAPVICDWLDVTFAPGQPLPWAEKFFPDSGGVARHQGDDVEYRYGQGGIIKLQSRARYQRLSLSGRVLAHFRELGAMRELLMHIAGGPHKLSRVDAALDVPQDAPGLLKSLRRRYRSKGVQLGQRGVTSRSYLVRRPDGQETGTFYAGHRGKAEVTARVYDKQLEQMEHAGQLLPPTTRYEITVQTGQPTLRDVDAPDAMFWHYASPALLPKPDPCPEWMPGNPYLWEAAPAVVDYEQRLIDAVRYSDDLSRMIHYAEQIEGGKEKLLELLRLHIRRQLSS